MNTACMSTLIEGRAICQQTTQRLRRRQRQAAVRRYCSGLETMRPHTTVRACVRERHTRPTTNLKLTAAVSSVRL
jgi:hypothetical protein